MRLSPLFRRFSLILVIHILTQIINVLSDEEIFNEYNLIVATSPYIQNYDDDFKVTTMYKISNALIKDQNGGGFKDENFRSIYYGNYSIELYPKTNSTGLRYLSLNENLKNHLFDIITPSNKSNNNLFQNSTFIQVYPAAYWRHNNITTSGYYCDAENNHIDTSGKNTADCFDAFDYNRKVVHAHNSKKKIILTIEWKPQNYLNSLRIIYTFNKNIYFDIEINIHDKNNTLLYRSLLNTSRNMTQLTIKSRRFNDDEKYKIVISKMSTSHHSNIDNMTPFSIYQIANYFQTSDSDNGPSINVIPGLFPSRHPSPHNVFSNSIDDKKHITTHNTIDSSANNCLNGGYRLKDKCVCSPGFRGVFCEKGCGPNTFGAECSGLCSLFATNGCRGIYFCTSSYGCTCSTGLTGRFCDEDCPPHTYGPNCNQNCSSECHDKTCDQYTGICTHHRLDVDESKNCTEKNVAYLRHPPELVSADHVTITVKINFESENIYCNNGFTKVKYYQLLWKDSNEKSYNYAKQKLCNSNKSVETLNGLKPGTEYNIGVLIIMDDGNLNKENIVYGLYSTICQKNPSINENTYQVIGGRRSINITWDKVSISRQQCPIIELSLTLSMINHERINLTQTFNINPSSKSSYIIRDLVPGYDYNVNLTPKTSLGVLTPSYTYKVKTKFTDEDVTIKNITAKYNDQHKTIFISWKPVINVIGLNDDIVDTTFTYTVKYKINRIFSCSLEEMKNNWTTITNNNNTDYNITDVIPHSQYMIQVILDSEDKNTTPRENLVYVLTPPSLPALKLSLERPLNITNNSASIKWKLEDSNCSHINGFFIGFFLELKNINDRTVQIKRTEDYNITFNDLKPMNEYELNIFVENNFGNSSESSSLSFNTKKHGEESMSDMIIYKINRKNHTLGLRWSYPAADKTVEQLNVSIEYNKFKHIDNNTFKPESCAAWPKYYCKTISYLNHLEDFSIKVKVESLKTVEIWETLATCCHNRSITPDPPRNLKVIDTQKNNVTLQWDIPWIFNGELKSFSIYGYEVKSLNNETCCEDIEPKEIPFIDEQPTYKYSLEGLKPGFIYSLSVDSQLTSKIHSSLNEHIEVTTPM